MTALDPHDDLDLDSDWRRFVELQNLPPAIRMHLQSERDLLADVLRSGDYRVVIEAGCADGSLFMPTVVAAGLDYIGVDVVAQAATATRHAIAKRVLCPGQRATAVHGDARDLQSIDGLAVSPERPLVVLPFNLFGIVSRPHEMLRSAAAIGADIMIFTYQQSAGAGAARADYFRRGGWPGGEVVMSDGTHYQGHHFISSVYAPDTLQQWLHAAGYHSALTPYGEIGLAARGTLPAGEVARMRPRAAEIVEPLA
jgi:hypothetical protein